MFIRLLYQTFRNGKNLLFRDKRFLCQFRFISSNTKTVKEKPNLADLNVLKERNFTKYSRRLLIDNVLNKTSSKLNSSLVDSATKRLTFGDSLPFFSIVACSLASGNGVLTKEDELEGLCWEIREAISKYQNKLEDHLIGNEVNEELQLDHFDIGPTLDKGANAVVYAANFKNQQPTATDTIRSETSDSKLDVTFEERINEELNFFSPARSLTAYLKNIEENDKNASTSVVKFNDEVKVYKDERQISSSSNSSLSSSVEEEIFIQERSDLSIFNYPWCLKMMFNYDIQSNAYSILRAMYKETLPVRNRTRKNVENWEQSIMDRTLTLPRHPNIVLMPGFFCDQIPNLRNSHILYPSALPPRINPTSGFGRNMTLFLLMKRYNCNLREYLNENDLEVRTRIILFAQLLEAVCHLNNNKIAHRDLKSDNILIDEVTDTLPILVISDFGCCLADKAGLKVPFLSEDCDRGGNIQLMAPEIICAKPSYFSLLNYTKSDLWTCGAIAYEIFGYQNPFYNTYHDGKMITNADYDEYMLPPLDDENIPTIVKKLIENILQRSPRKRLDCNIASNVIQLYLWAPSSWIKYNRNPSNSELLEWLLSLTTKVLCERIGSSNTNFSRRTYTEYILISTFLSRANLKDIRQALNWMQSL